MTATETIEVSQTRKVSGASKFILSALAIAHFCDRFIDQIGKSAREDHHDAHDKDPHEQLNLDHFLGNRQKDERNERHAGDAIGLKTIRRRSDRISGIVAGAIRDNSRIARIVFLNFEDDLHQVRADIRNLGKDAAGNTQRSSAERLADGKADKAVARHNRRG